MSNFSAGGFESVLIFFPFPWPNKIERNCMTLIPIKSCVQQAYLINLRSGDGSTI
ncbi:hypothetical protein glysoja_047139 [Glycine soja]|uniref:Uncharacterized protein n=1 Tax=Glycine soja TaxID=3848 RepID=A0A0B2NVZ0_GLYSO|nr:hypothetical protein glysoja_047139 [Glycine soja]